MRSPPGTSAVPTDAVALLDDRPGWHASALCAQTDPEAFFPEKGGSVREAKQICNNCEVRAACLEYALSTDSRFGVWGGLTERERRRLKEPRRPEETTDTPGPRDPGAHPRRQTP